MTLMRATVHMVTPRDAAFLRPLMQPAIERDEVEDEARRMAAFAGADDVRFEPALP
jgi:hypothetical protein